jgi:hypothetical protein
MEDNIHQSNMESYKPEFPKMAECFKDFDKSNTDCTKKCLLKEFCQEETIKTRGFSKEINAEDIIMKSLDEKYKIYDANKETHEYTLFLENEAKAIGILFSNKNTMSINIQSYTTDKSITEGYANISDTESIIKDIIEKIENFEA